MRYAEKSSETVSNALFQSTEIVIRRVLELIKTEGLEDKYADRTTEFNNPNWRYGKSSDWVKPEVTKSTDKKPFYRGRYGSRWWITR